MPNIENGMIHVYTGNGKGKSTAAFGIALRAIGHGFKVKIIQFMKSPDMFNEYGEIIFFKNNPNIEIFQFGAKGWVNIQNPEPEHIIAANNAINKTLEILQDNITDVLILDEILYAYNYKLITKEQIEMILSSKKKSLELILTGRNAPDFIIEKSDLVSEVKEIKHYFQKRKAIKGIEY